MDILDELAEKFSITLDSELCNDSNYLKAIALIHELSAGLSAEQSAELDDIAASLVAAAFNAGIRSGLRLGARIAVGLIGYDKS
ncbi:MAG: hypothetical protein J6Y64_04500 [Ruminococcus sp.]|nr:hypothetical protein [Ruminococcus sp.]